MLALTQHFQHVAEYFGNNKPATTTVQVVRLATDPRCLIGINAIAVIDEDARGQTPAGV